MIDATDRQDATEAAAAARYRQRRLTLMAVVLLVTVVPIVALGTWWMWPLLVIPAALAAPLAGGTGLIATLLACAIGLAAASGGQVTSAEVLMGFIAIVVVAALGAAHAGMGQGVMNAMPSFGGRARTTGPAPGDVFDIIAARDCRRAAETGSPVSVAIVAVPRVDWIAERHGEDILADLLDACSSAVMGVTSGSDLVVEQADGRYAALVPGTADSARELGERIAMALEGVAVRDHDGLRVTAGSVGVGVAEWREGDPGPDALIERAGAALQQDMVRADRPADDQVTGEFRPAAIADAA